MNENESNWAACIVYYQDSESLTNLIKCLESQTLKPTEIFVADNNSIKQPSNTFTIPISFFKLDTNLGFAGGANYAINKAISKGFKKLILFSQDVEMDNDSCEIIIKNLNQDNTIVFPTMINRKNGRVFSKGGTINKFTGKIKLHQSNSNELISWADGSCLGFSSKTFQSVNGFYEKYFMYFEDVDFCYKVKSQGGQIVHIETNVSQKPNGPSPFLRSRNSVIFSRRTKLNSLKLSVTIRNLVGSLILFAKFNFKDAFSRFFGVYKGWTLEIE